MERFKFCVEFTVPDEIDLEEHRSAGADFTSDLVPNPVMESIRAAVDSDSRWTLKRVASLRPARTDPKRQAVASATYNGANRLTSWAGTTLAHDADGNLTSHGTNAYSWNARGQLATISGAVGASFTYDAFGRRSGKTVDGVTTQFLYDGLNPVQELAAGGTPTANLLTGLGIDEVYRRDEIGGSTRHFLTDALGSTMALADNGGLIQTEYTYEPFGAGVAGGEANSNAFQFTGRENDGATNLLFYRARYYSPTFQRFISEDPLAFAGGGSESVQLCGE